MKKLFSLFATILAAGVGSAQTTITIDGNADDWANSPIYTEPGVFPMLKFHVNQEGVNIGSGNAFAALLVTENPIEAVDKPVFYVDADKSNTTGNAPWVLPAMGYDYEMASWTGTAAFNGNTYELAVPVSSFSGAAFTGSFWTSLTYNWGAFYVPTDPGTEGWKWNENLYHPYLVEAQPAIANINGTHVAADAFTHQCLAPGATLNFSVSGGAQDVAFWASWPVDLTLPGVYTVSANVTSTDNASCDLYLVDMATNQVVATHTSSDVWAPSGETAYGTWDLSAIPSGKYMLKMKNHVQWSHMILSSVTLTTEAGPVTSLENVANSANTIKTFRNGQLVILRDGVEYNVMGAQVR